MNEGASGDRSIGIRQHIYRMPEPAKPQDEIARAIDSYLLYFGIDADTV